MLELTFSAPWQLIVLCLGSFALGYLAHRSVACWMLSIYFEAQRKERKLAVDSYVNEVSEAVADTVRREEERFRNGDF